MFQISNCNKEKKRDMKQVEATRQLKQEFEKTLVFGKL